MIKLKVIRGPKIKGQKFDIENGASLIVGREKGCDIYLPSSGVSKKHCQLIALPGGKAEIRDLGSSNGTFVNGMLVKRFVAKPGDQLSIADFTIQFGIGLPTTILKNSQPDLAAVSVDDADSSEVVTEKKNLGDKIQNWLDGNLYPWTDKLSSRFDVRFMSLLVLALWAFLIVLNTTIPFKEKANARIVDSSLNVARLYARQLVRLNQQAIIDQRYRNLVAQIDEVRNQTPGIYASYILDTKKGQILAPAELAGSALPNRFASKAILHDKEWFEIDPNGHKAYISSPIQVNDGTKNITEATAFVIYLPTLQNFTMSSLLNEIVNSLFWALLLSFVVFLFIYRWINGSVTRLIYLSNKAMKNGETQLENPEIRWPALQILSDQISTLLSKGGGAGDAAYGDSMALAVNESSPYESFSHANLVPTAVLNDQFEIIAWNERLEKLVGVRANFAVGQALSAASRDVAFEENVKDKCREAAGQIGQAAKVDFEIHGDMFDLNVIYDGNFYLVTLVKQEEEV